MRRPCWAASKGQASVETIALVPVLLVVAVGLMQLLAVGYASVLAGAAAEAGALALAGGGDPRAAAREALPGWSESHARIEIEGGRVEIQLRPPSLLKALAQGLEVSAAAEVEEP
ncbi:MAG: hypothetical protein QOE60_2777 [Thermoleophilaceae bacterium]|nr:hypothetical protein [Thermoleophilaceae bacterium]